MKTVEIINGKLVIGNTFEFTKDSSEKVTPIDITKDVIKALNLRIARCVSELEANVSKGVVCIDNNIISYTESQRHFSIIAYKKMVEAVNMLLAGKSIKDLDAMQRIQVVKALANMSENLFEHCVKEVAIDIAIEYLLAV